MYRDLVSRKRKSPRCERRHSTFDSIRESQLRIIIVAQARGVVSTGRPLAMQPRGALDCVPIEPAEVGRKRREPAKCGVEQPHASAKRPALEMMVGGGDLNQSPKELLDVGLRDEPKLLPRFVRVPELARVEVLDAADEVGREFGDRSLPGCAAISLSSFAAGCRSRR